MISNVTSLVINARHDCSNIAIMGISCALTPIFHTLHSTDKNEWLSNLFVFSAWILMKISICRATLSTQSNYPACQSRFAPSPPWLCGRAGRPEKRTVRVDKVNQQLPWFGNIFTPMMRSCHIVAWRNCDFEQRVTVTTLSIEILVQIQITKQGGRGEMGYWGHKIPITILLCNVQWQIFFLNYS